MAMFKRLIVSSFIALLSVAFSSTSILSGQVSQERCLIVTKDAKNPTMALGIDRIRSFYNGTADIADDIPDVPEQHPYELIIVLGTVNSSQVTREVWQNCDAGDGDCYIVRTISQDPLTMAVTGMGQRGTLYAAYRMAELLETKVDLSSIDIKRIPEVKWRYAFVQPATHQDRFHRPDLFVTSLRELPRYGFNGIMMSPGATAATPKNYHEGMPFPYPANLTMKDDRMDPQPEELKLWKEMFKELDDYRLETMVFWPCLVPPEFDRESIMEYYYHGGPEPPGYLESLRKYNYNLAESPLLQDIGMDKISEEQVLPVYIEALSRACKEHNKTLAAWTHAAGITSAGIRSYREALYKHPEIWIIEDDYWPNA